MSDQSDLIDAMRQALGRNITRVNGQPVDADLTTYFRSFEDNPDAALAAYRRYARAFYVHVTTATGDRTADVDWPGHACDQWSEIVARPRRQGQRIVDCEGYAFLADRMLTAAGWTLAGYQVLYLRPDRSAQFEFHMVSVLDHADATTTRVFIGSPEISTSPLNEARRVWPDAFHNVCHGPLEGSAFDAAMSASNLAASGSECGALQMRPRSSRVPGP